MEKQGRRKMKIRDVSTGTAIENRSNISNCSTSKPGRRHE
jgi:hypothetical protein